MSGYYHSISPSIGISFHWKMVWHLKVPPWVAFFSWTAAFTSVVNPGLASLFNEGQIISWASECDGVGGFVVFDFGSEGEAWDSDEGSLDWEHLGEPLEVASLVMDNSMVTEITTIEEIGRKVDVDNTKLSQWVTNRIKAF